MTLDLRRHLEVLAADEDGATSIEYGLIALIVAVGIAATLRHIPEQLNIMFQMVIDGFQQALGV